jgi:predicted MPP superfamily phosphohydrolase
MAQRFWLNHANRIINRMGSSRWRGWCRGLVITILGFVIVSFADRIFLRSFPRSGLVSWAMGLSQLWLITSSIAYLAVKLVNVLEWFWGLLPKPRVPVLAPAAAGECNAPLHSSTPNHGSAGVDAGLGDAPQDAERRKLFQYAAMAAACLPFGASIYGFASERLHYTVQRVELPIHRLPAPLDGLRIVQLSDIHIGDFMPREEVRRAVAMANELEADVAMLTGDYVTGSRDPLEDCAAELGQLRAPLGIWACNGNHEIYAGVEDEIEAVFLRHGMRLLRQQNVELQWRGAKFNLIGVDYQKEFAGLRARAPMLPGVESLMRRDIPNILLSHNPNSFPKAAELGIELSLAGHTHGGQIQIEIVDHRWNPARFMTSYVAGLYQLPMASVVTGPGAAATKACLYVNRGLGTIGIPARFGVKPEISLLTLRSA